MPANHTEQERVITGSCKMIYLDEMPHPRRCERNLRKISLKTGTVLYLFYCEIRFFCFRLFDPS
jgi:hypothetical protein